MSFWSTITASFQSWIRITFAHGLVWPLCALAVLFAFNAVFTEGFFHIDIVDGHLYGSIIDILDRATPVILVSLGMTLVIGTAGIDLSVGANVPIYRYYDGERLGRGLEFSLAFGIRF